MRTNDAVDEIQHQWGRLRPELDLDGIAVVGRVLRSAALIVQRSDEVLARHGLSRGEFDILAALRRSGRPQSPGTLRTISLASGPATTKRLKSVAGRGLIVRAANPSDGRGVLISLTSPGIALVDKVLPVQLDAERELLAGIEPGERPAVVESLRRVLSSIEHAGSHGQN